MNAAIMDRDLTLEARAAARLREILSTITDEDGIADSIASETNLAEAIEAVLDGITLDEAMVAGLDIKANEMKARRGRLEHRIARRRSAIEQALSVAEIYRMELATGTLSLRRVSPGLEIEDETAIPPEFFVPQAPKLDRTKLKDALKMSCAVPGARLGNGGQSLTIRRA